MANPTPGPWQVRTLENFGFNVVHYGGGDKFNILRVAKAGEEANARLIAAAPELLVALTETWRVLRAAGTLNLTNGVQLGQTSWYVKICDAERLSDAAIAKALGQ